MRVTSQPNVSPDANANTEKASRAKTSQSQESGNEIGIPAGGRTFASVLDEVVHSRSRGDQERPSDDRRENAGPRSTEPMLIEKEIAPLNDEPEDTSLGVSFEGGPVREIRASAEPVGVREIVHIADLEKIVLTVRTQLVAGGQPQVTLELPRSVLQGLYVKLTADRKGRITADFLAATDSIKSQIDARSAELADMLRSRGINLESLKSSVSTDLSSRSDSNERQRSARYGELGAVSRARSVARSREDDVSAIDNTESVKGSTYRA